MNKKMIGILFGGKSSEHEVSLQSAAAIISNIPTSKYKLYLIGITKEGNWYHYQGDVRKITNNTWHQEMLNPVTFSLEADKKSVIEIIDGQMCDIKLDAVFPVLHGKNGEDGTVQGLLQLIQMPIIGCDILSSALCMDKKRAHDLVKNEGILVPEAVLLTKADNYQNKLQQLRLPVFVKPLKAGSSYGITKVVDSKDLKQAITYAFKFDDQVIVEEEVKGFEVGCAIIGIKELIVGRVDEIELSGGFFDYDEKYTLKTSKIHLPARISKEIETQIQTTAKHIYQILGCKVFARVDMFLTPDLKIYFNEVNTIPGFTSHSRFPQMMKGANYQFQDILEMIIEIGLKNENHCFTSR